MALLPNEGLKVKWASVGNLQQGRCEREEKKREKGYAGLQSAVGSWNMRGHLLGKGYWYLRQTAFQNVIRPLGTAQLRQ